MISTLHFPSMPCSIVTFVLWGDDTKRYQWKRRLHSDVQGTETFSYWLFRNKFRPIGQSLCAVHVLQTHCVRFTWLIESLLSPTYGPALLFKWKAILINTNYPKSIKILRGGTLLEKFSAVGNWYFYLFKWGKITTWQEVQAISAEYERSTKMHGALWRYGHVSKSALTNFGGFLAGMSKEQVLDIWVPTSIWHKTTLRAMVEWSE